MFIGFRLFFYVPATWSSFIDSNGPNLTVQEQSEWEFGLGFSLGYSSTRGLIASVNPSVQYFVLPKLSLGGFIQYYTSRDFKYVSAGPSATFFIYSSSNYALVLNQKIRFREYIEPDDFAASKSTTITILAADWRMSGPLSLRVGVGYLKSLDDEVLNYYDNKKDEWILPAIGFAYYL